LKDHAYFILKARPFRIFAAYITGTAIGVIILFIAMKIRGIYNMYIFFFLVLIMIIVFCGKSIIWYFKGIRRIEACESGLCVFYGFNEKKMKISNANVKDYRIRASSVSTNIILVLDKNDKDLGTVMKDKVFKIEGYLFPLSEFDRLVVFISQTFSHLKDTVSTQ
jgi:hypothetical protein